DRWADYVTNLRDGGAVWWFYIRCGNTANCRVEMWRGGVGQAYPLSEPFGGSVPHQPDPAPFPHPAHRTGLAVFPHPALGEGVSCVRTRIVAASARQTNQPKLPVQIIVRVFLVVDSRLAMLGPQPLTQPPANVAVHVLVGTAHGAPAEVVRPSNRHTVDAGDQFLR